MLSTEIKFWLDKEDLYSGTLYTTVYLDDIEIGAIEEERLLTEDVFHMITNKPEVEPIFLKEKEGVVKVHWGKYTITDLVFAVYLTCSPDNWWRLVQYIRETHQFSKDDEEVRE